MAPALTSNFSTLARQAVDNSANAFDREKNEIFLSYITKQNATVPQIELIFADGGLGSNTTAGKNYFTMLAGLAHPFSSGSVHIGTTSALDRRSMSTRLCNLQTLFFSDPIIDPQYFKNDFDILAVAQAAKYIRKVILG
jgi:hypothetical protein